MPQISQAASIYASQLFWLAIVFAAVYFGIGRAMVPKIERTIDDRNARIAADLAAAQAARDTAHASEEGYNASLDAARGSALKLVADAKAKAAASTETKVKAGNADQEAALAEATARIGKAKDKALADIESTTVDAVEAIVGKLSGSTPDRATVAARVKAELTNG
ncbi:ATPase [Sphingomonas panacisoli]|uniref:ATP synthase subunit b n=1 Tax=Sphingomonas panacisoli TaxID=1813879 RepID=A0A5B8LJD1_9SPHN|nr:ATPase [Sphingomonas panacisoli]QDZ08328.1 ATPase [Sphingomonas panacisoli]